MSELIPLDVLAGFCPSARWDELAKEWSIARVRGWVSERQQSFRCVSSTPITTTKSVSVTLDDLVNEQIERVVAETGSIERAAKILGISPATIYRRRKRRKPALT